MHGGLLVRVALRGTVRSLSAAGHAVWRWT